MRHEILLRDGWSFFKTETSRPEAVTLPHTWNAVDGQDGGNDYYRGTCRYVRGLKKSELPEGGEVWLEADGAAHTAEVFLNGEKLARHEGGFSRFRVNLTEFLREENELAITVDNSDNDTVYPQKADFTFYGGLYRDVKILVVPKTHFALGYRGAPGLKVTPEVDLEKKTARVTAEAWVEGAADAVEFTVAGQTKRAPVENGRAQAVFTLENVHLWDGLDDPYLYEASAALESGDAVRTRFGCRVFEIDPQKGFFLNGRSYPLRGVSRHQDCKGAGSALTLEHHRRDMAIIREIGANTLRLAHYQHAQEFYDLCDENGLVVWAVAPTNSTFR